MGQRLQETAWRGCSIRHPLGEYNEVLEKFLLEMLAVSLLHFYGGNSCAGILCLSGDTRHAQGTLERNAIGSSPSVYLYLLSSSKWRQGAPKEKG
jgi:hypothetical protein